MQKKLIVVFIFTAILTGCASEKYIDNGLSYNVPATTGEMSRTNSPVSGDVQRKIIKRASQEIAVDNLKKSAGEAALIAKEAGGFVQNENSYNNENYYVTLKVPSDKLEDTLDKLKTLGDETNRSISKEDVTADVLDTEAVLKNKKALRDRLRQLAGQSKDVKDIVAVESELSKVQGEIDSMEARLKSINGQVEMSEINLNLTKKIVLGPLGWVFKGVWWVIEKLFVLSGT